MQAVGRFVFVLSIWALVQCSPFDDGKYKHKSYDIFDDGKYYRPLDEGKYVPSDEGKYTYIYQQGVFPYDGTYKHLGRGDSNEYIGYQIYAPRYPFIHTLIKAFISKYVSPDLGGVGDAIVGSWSANNFNKIKVDEEVALKCNVIDPVTKNTTDVEVVTHSQILQRRYTTSDRPLVTGGLAHSSPKESGLRFRGEMQLAFLPPFPADRTYTAMVRYPPNLNLKEGEKLGTFYNFKGSKVLSTVSNSLTNKLKLEYEVFVKIVEDVSQ